MNFLFQISGIFALFFTFYRKNGFLSAILVIHDEISIIIQKNDCFGGLKKVGKIDH